jgi:hypothetical protein
MRAARHILATGLLALAAPAAAAIGDEAADQAPFLARCQIVQTCRIEGGCADLPAPGEQIVEFDGTDTFLGQSEDTLSPVDRAARIENLHPLPRIDGPRRSILLDLDAEHADRRFALFTQRATPEAAEPVLQTVYFVLDCWNLPQ